MMPRDIDPGHEDACRRCGVIPADWEELQDGLCPECLFEEVVSDG